MSMSTGGESDFVWAVRLAKIWKRTIDKTWKFGTQSDGATFSADEDEEVEKEDVLQALEDEGIGEDEKIWVGDGEGFIVM